MNLFHASVSRLVGIKAPERRAEMREVLPGGTSCPIRNDDALCTHIVRHDFCRINGLHWSVL